MKSGLWVGLRLAVGIGAIAFLVWRVDLARAGSTLKAAERSWLLAALGAQLGSKLCWLLRWRTLLHSTGHKVPAPEMLRLILVGLFFNNFLPTTVGGDVMRGLGLGKSNVPKATAVASVIADRLVGLMALGFIATLGGILGVAFWPGDGPWLASVVFAVAVVGLVVGLTRPAVLARIRPSGSARLARMGAARLERVLEGISFLSGRGRTAVRALGFSMALSVFSACFHWSIGNAIGIEVPLAAYFVIVPAVMLSAMLPITVNGLGLREIGFVGFLGAQGVPAATAAVFAFLAFVGPLVFAVLGGILFLWGARASRGARQGVA